MLYMEEERLPRADLYIAPETYRRRQELMRERFERMLAYAANETECRSSVLERYFGVGDPTPCGGRGVRLRPRQFRQDDERAADSADLPGIL